MSKGVNNSWSSLWTCHISNIPSYQIKGMDPIVDLSIYDLYLKSFSFPDISNQFHETQAQGYTQYQPISMINTGFPNIQLVYNCNENMENYLRLFFYLQGMRFGVPTNGNASLVESVIREVRFEVLDNEKRPVMRTRFIDCPIESLSQLTMKSGSSDLSSFTLNLKFHKLEVEPIPVIGNT